jgi:hypothetical protein
VNKSKQQCCLCGRLGTTENPVTREHVPPRQFYPKSVRDGLNLWIAPTHAACNAHHKLDEEYFYHCFFPLVVAARAPIAPALTDDLRRRLNHQQSRSILRSLLRSQRTVTASGLYLPSGICSLDIDLGRVQQVAIKIARCIHFLDHDRFMPLDHCIDIRLCERDTDVPDLYRLSWEMAKTNVWDLPASKNGLVLAAQGNTGRPKSVFPQVFDYRSFFFQEEGLHLYSLRFWESFLFCLIFKEQAKDPRLTDACSQVRA